MYIRKAMFFKNWGKFSMNRNQISAILMIFLLGISSVSVVNAQIINGNLISSEIVNDRKNEIHILFIIF